SASRRRVSHWPLLRAPCRSIARGISANFPRYVGRRSSNDEFHFGTRQVPPTPRSQMEPRTPYSLQNGRVAVDGQKTRAVLCQTTYRCEMSARADRFPDATNSRAAVEALPRSV